MRVTERFGDLGEGERGGSPGTTRMGSARRPRSSWRRAASGIPGPGTFFSAGSPRNSLKSFESDKEIQENPRKSKPIFLGFSWISLVWLGSAWRNLAGGRGAIGRDSPALSPSEANSRAATPISPRTSCDRSRGFRPMTLDADRGVAPGLAIAGKWRRNPLESLKMRSHRGLTRWGSRVMSRERPGRSASRFPCCRNGKSGSPSVNERATGRRRYR